MRNLSQIFVLFCFPLLLLSCERAEDLLTFSIITESEFVIQSGLDIGTPVNLETPDVETNSSQKFENNDTRADLVKDVFLKNSVLNIMSPEDQTFSFLKSIEVYMSAEDLPEILIAEKQDIPEDIGRELELDTTNDALDAYIKKEEISLRFKTVTRETITENIKINCRNTFDVTADPI